VLPAVTGTRSADGSSICRYTIRGISFPEEDVGMEPILKLPARKALDDVRSEEDVPNASYLFKDVS